MTDHHFVHPSVRAAASSTRKPSDVYLDRLMDAVETGVRVVWLIGLDSMRAKANAFDAIVTAKAAYDAERLREGGKV